MIEKKVRREDIEDMMNLTTLQKAMIYHYINDDRNNKYRIQICIEFNEALDYSKVKESWDKVACDNEMLRTVFRWKNISQPVQIVLKKQPISVCYYDVTYSNNIEEAFNKIKNYQREEAMNLEREAFRVSICKVSDIKSIMLIQYHHIILDGWSFGIILEEFIRAYQGEKVFPKTKMKYSDYINYIQNRNNSKGISFWKEYLLGVKNACELYSDIVRQTEGRERIVEVPLYIPDAFIQKSTDLSKLYGLTFASILYFVWSYILSRYTKSSDILFGTSVSGREHYMEGIQNSVGEYANAVPFRYYFDDMEKSCLDVIKKICNATIKRNQYSDMPLDQIKEYCGLINLNTLYNTIVVVDNYPIDNLQCYNGEYIKIKEIYELNDYDMTLQVFLYHGVEFKLVYNENKFSSEWVSSFASCFTQSFCWIITHLNEPIHSIQMLSAAEKERLIYTYGQCKENYLCNETIMDIFERKVSAHPNDIALIYQKKVMTYQELNEAATKLASYLMNIMHTKTSDIIGIMIDRSFEMVIGIFGILKLGAAYLPIGIDYPKSRIEYILQNSNTELVLTAGRHKEIEHLARCIDVCNIMSVSCISDARLPGSKSTNPAYVLYTSGTTGKPKGVIISNESVVNMLHILNQYYPIHPQEAILLKTVYTFDISVTELFGWILGDGKLVIPENYVEKNVDELVQYIKEYHILGMNFVPSAFLGLLNVVSEQQCQIINQMKYIFLCGETVQPELVNLFVKKIHGPKLVNLYGPTETTIYATASAIELRHYAAYGTISIGKPLPNYGVLILDSDNEIVPENMDGELCLYGKGVSLGYLNNQEMTKEKFIELDWLGEKIYKTGDLARWDSSGNLYFRGRMDSQVKLRGYRIELGEIENTLLEHENIEKAAVLLTGDKLDILSAFIVCKVKMDEQSVKNLCRKWLPEYMVPTEYIFCDNLLYTENGKIDKNALYMKSMERKTIDKNGQIWNSMRNKKSFLDVKQEIVDLWTSVLNKSISQDKTFFENGGNSLTILKVYQVLKERYELKVTDLFQYMTIDALASYLSHETEHSYREKQLQKSSNIDDIAVIGMGGKYPLANDLNEFWENLCNGVEASRELTEEEFNKIEDKDKNNTNYVRYTVSLEDYDCFDSEFFGYSARESEMTDPQQRVFLECAYHALEDAGIATQFYSGRIGVMAGTSMSSYLLEQGNIKQKDRFNWMIANDKDFLNTKISYKLNLTGPSVNVQTACSSSLVAVHLACNMLKNLDADVMVVGGVSIRIPHNTGYLYQEGGILAKDGHCRAFDIDATGTISGNGCGVIILTRLQRAISERAHIYAIIKGSAINNDGNHKISFSAPSIRGQVEVIANSLRNANLMPSQIGYIETHGTGTKLGDPIEFAALREIYTNSRGDVQPCAIGSIKSNIGHLDAAAGITGLVKAIMCLEKKKLVPSINYHQPNPELNLHGSGLYVNTEYKDWECTDDIRRAAVSSFGIGGTNASVIVEEYVKQHENVTEEMNGYYVLLLSAKRESAVAQMSDEIEQFADANPNEILNIQYTLAAGRNHYNYRTAILTSMINGKLTYDQTKVFYVEGREREITFMFPGQGSHYDGMGKSLYYNSKLFHSQMDNMSALFAREMGIDYIKILYHEEKPDVDMQPGIFMCEYALACYLESIGIQPDIVVGHSLGEYTAACLSGIFSLEDTIHILSERCRLVQSISEGCMAVVNTNIKDSRIQLGKASVAAINSEAMFVISGEREVLEKVELECKSARIPFRYIKSNRAYHSYMLDTICNQFQHVMESIEIHPARIPIVSCNTGRFMNGEYYKPEYWVSHLRNTVLFDQCLTTISNQDQYVYMEVGPGRTLMSYAKKKKKIDSNLVFSTMNEQMERKGEQAYVKLIADLWNIGAKMDVNKFRTREDVHKISLPLYPFKKTHFLRVKTKKALNIKEGTVERSYNKPKLDNEYIAPISMGERIITDVFEEKLGVGKIGMTDDFYSLGGDSLIAGQIVSELNMIFQTEVGLSDVLTNPTVKGTTDAIEHALGSRDLFEEIAMIYNNL